MATVGVTGHSNLTDRTAELARDELEQVLKPLSGDLIGMTCLARGTDQLFADVVLGLGGRLRVVVPAADYFTTISDPRSRQRCENYLSAAELTIAMDFEKSGPSAYLAASRYLVDHCDMLIAVWDGSTSSGTADAVAYARTRDRRIIVVWPDGAQRSLPRPSTPVCSSKQAWPDD